MTDKRQITHPRNRITLLYLFRRLDSLSLKMQLSNYLSSFSRLSFYIATLGCVWIQVEGILMGKLESYSGFPA